MPLRRLLFSALFAISLVVVPAGFGFDQFKPVSPEELKMMTEPLAPGAPAIILYRQVDRDDSGANARQVNYVRIKILTEEGRKYADIEIPFLKGSGSDITSVKARTIRPDGSIVDFEGKPFDKQIVKAKGVKYMAKTFTMPDVQVGSIIEYTYTESMPEYLVFDSHWIVSDELFTRRAAFSLKPAGQFACRWTWHTLPSGAQPKQGNDSVIRMEANNIAPFPTEDYMPPANELKSRVDFFYSYSPPNMDPQKFWIDAGKKMNGDLERFVDKRKAMEQALATVVLPGDTPEQKLQKIYARVQQMRNTSFEQEKSAQETKREKQKQVNNVEEVWKQGYGTGVQLTWLFLGLARAAGVEAYGAWVSDRRNYFFNPASLDEGKLNTNVVLVKLDGKDLYFDPGAAFTPYGMLPWDETGVTGLRLDKNGSTWIKTWLPQSDISRIERKANLKLSSTGDLEGTVTVTYTGLEALRLRMDERHADDAAKKKYLEELVDEQVPVAAEVELTSKPDWTSSSPTFVAEYKMKVPGWMSGAGRRGLIPVGLFSAAEKRVFDHTERKHPIYFEYPFETADEIAITLPLGWEVGSLPAAQVQGNGTTVGYSLKADKDSGTLRLNRKLKIDLVLLETKYYMALRNFFQAVRTGDEEQVMLQPIAARSSK